MNGRFVLKAPELLAPGRVLVERRAFRGEWTEVHDHARYDQVPERHSAARTHDSERSEKVLGSSTIAIAKLAVHYRSWRDVLTYDGVAAPNDVLAGKSYVLDAAPKRVVAQGSVPEPERTLVEFEYAALGATEPVFKIAALTPVAVGEGVPSLAELVRALLYRCGRGAGGYIPDMKTRIGATLRRVYPVAGGDAAEFAVHVEPEADPTLLARLRLDGTLTLGPNGWPLALHLAGGHERSVFDRRGELTIHSKWTLEASWS
jgi:hypothetical protein